VKVLPDFGPVNVPVFRHFLYAAAQSGAELRRLQMLSAFVHVFWHAWAQAEDAILGETYAVVPTAIVKPRMSNAFLIGNLQSLALCAGEQPSPPTTLCTR